MNDIKYVMFIHLYEIAMKRDAGAIYVTPPISNKKDNYSFIVSLGHIPAITCQITNEYVHFSALFPKTPISIKDHLKKRHKVRRHVASIPLQDIEISRWPSVVVEWSEPDSIYHSEYLLNKMITIIRRTTWLSGHEIRYKVEDHELPRLIDFATEAYRINVLERQRNQRKKSNA